MKLYCDRNSRIVHRPCKSYLVVAERGDSKIIYYRIFREQKEATYKQLSADLKILKPLVNMQEYSKISIDDFKEIVLNVKNTYNSLKKTQQEHKTLSTISTKYTEFGLNISLNYGIVLEDNSIVFFYDFSDIITGRLSSIFTKGGLQ